VGGWREREEEKGKKDLKRAQNNAYQPSPLFNLDKPGPVPESQLFSTQRSPACPAEKVKASNRRG
jgi:hypothetical protein